MNDELLKIGILTRLHGHRGELQCRAENSLWEDADDPTWLFLRLDGLDVPFRVLDWRTKGTDELLFTFKGVDSEEKALRLVGAEAFMLLREANVPTEGDLMTWQDLALAGPRRLDGAFALRRRSPNSGCRYDYCQLPGTPT